MQMEEEIVMALMVKSGKPKCLCNVSLATGVIEEVEWICSKNAITLYFTTVLMVETTHL